MYVTMTLYTHSDLHTSENIHIWRISCTTRWPLSFQVLCYDTLHVKQLPGSLILLPFSEMA